MSILCTPRSVNRATRPIGLYDGAHLSVSTCAKRTLQLSWLRFGLLTLRFFLESNLLGEEAVPVSSAHPVLY
jgi:hypothetical protein